MSIFKDEGFFLKNHNKLCENIRDPEVMSNVKLINSALSEGDLEIKIDDDLLKHLFKGVESYEDVLQFLKEKFKEYKLVILLQIFSFGINFWINEDIKFDKYTIKISRFPNPTTSKIKWIFKKNRFKPYLYVLNEKQEYVLDKNAHFIIHNEPNFITKEYNSAVNSLNDIIDGFKKAIKEICNGITKFPKFIINEKFPPFKTMTEYTLMNLYFLHKNGFTTREKSPTLEQLTQTQVGCDLTGQPTQTEGSGGVMLGTLQSLERNIPELYKNEAFTGVFPEKIKISNVEKEKLFRMLPGVPGLKKYDFINTLRVKPFSEIEWVKSETKPVEILKTLDEIKKEMIKTEFGRMEARRTKSGSQLENKTINYVIHFYKDMMERTISKIIVSTIFDSSKGLDRDDMSIYEKVQVFINSDDIINEDTLKFLIDVFRNDFKIVRQLVKSGTGVDIFEIKFGRDFDEDEMDDDELNATIAPPTETPNEQNKTPKTDSKESNKPPKRGDNEKIDKFKKIITDPKFKGILKRLKTNVKKVGLTENEIKTLSKIISLLEGKSNSKKRKRDEESVKKDVKKVTTSEEPPKKKLKTETKKIKK